MKKHLFVLFLISILINCSGRPVFNSQFDEFDKLLAIDTFLYDGSKPPKTYRNTLFAELGGNGILGSVNYDRITEPLGNNFRMSFRIGIGPNILTERYLPIDPIVEINFLIGKKHNFEFGFGETFSTWTVTNYTKYGEKSSYNRFELIETLRLGYRFQRPTGGFFLRAAITPIIGDNEITTSDIFMWGGLSVGYTF